MYEVMECIVCGHRWNERNIKFPDPPNNDVAAHTGTLNITCPQCGSHLTADIKYSGDWTIIDHTGIPAGSARLEITSSILLRSSGKE